MRSAIVLRREGRQDRGEGEDGLKQSDRHRAWTESTHQKITLPVCGPKCKLGLVLTFEQAAVVLPETMLFQCLMGLGKEPIHKL